MFSIGIIGVGHMGQVHLRAFQALSDVNVVAISARSAARLRQVGEEFGVSARYTDYREMLLQPGLDAVAVCTPTASHAEITLAAARAAKHVLCEKPMAVSYLDAVAMVRECARAGVNLAVCSGRARAGIYPVVGDITQARVSVDELGQLFYAKVSGPWRFRGRPGIDVLKKAAWYREARSGGGGVLMDLGVYSLDLLQYMTGDLEPVAVSAAVFQGVGGGHSAFGYDVEEHAALLLRSSAGWVATVELANASHIGRDDAFSLVLCGTRGTLRLRSRAFGSAATLSVSSAVASTALLPDDSARRDLPGLRTCTVDLPPPSIDMFAEFVTSCLERRAPLMSGDAGLRVMQIVRLAYLSAAAGRETEFGELLDPARTGDT